MAVSPASSTSLNSLVDAPFGSRLKDTRKPSISGLGWTMGALMAPALASARASGNSAGELVGMPLKSMTNWSAPVFLCGPLIKPARVA